MINFFKISDNQIIALETDASLKENEIKKLSWLFGDAKLLNENIIKGYFVGPRKEMITPWSTNAVEIAANMGVRNVKRMEEFFPVENEHADFDPMLQCLYIHLDQNIFTINHEPEDIREVDDIARYNKEEGLALSPEEIQYLIDLSKKLKRNLTDSEVFGFSQVNSEHCRHKIFNGIFIIDGEKKESSLFELIRKTTHTNPNKVVSAYKDNCAFSEGPRAEQFAPVRKDISEYFVIRDINTILSLKAETHNFPTTVEPFNGASTGTGGEIRDRIGGGKGALPLAGTAVYMTSYPRLENSRSWEKAFKERPWLYQSPEEILIKASNGASDFGNKFGQPLICGSLLTFEHFENAKKFAYD
ncbi:MAG: phosphoribosylformylglycinamidine synthase, partial [Bacteroidota bacterium]